MPKSHIRPEILAYIRKTKAFVGKQSPMKLLPTAPARYARAIKGLKEAQLNRRPSPKKWSIKEIIGHVADSEIIYGCRYRTILGEPGCMIVGYDQDKTSDVLRYRRHRIGRIMEKYRLLRADQVDMLRRLTPAERKRYGVHSERGRESVEQIALLLAGHDLNHLAQIHAIKKKFGW